MEHTMRAKKRLCEYGMINQILGRIHVGESHLAAARAVFAGMSPNGRMTYRTLGRWEKRQIIRLIRYYHTTHRNTYGLVMSGNLGGADWAYALLNIAAMY